MICQFFRQAMYSILRFKIVKYPNRNTKLLSPVLIINGAVKPPIIEKMAKTCRLYNIAITIEKIVTIVNNPKVVF